MSTRSRCSALSAARGSDVSCGPSSPASPHSISFNVGAARTRCGYIGTGGPPAAAAAAAAPSVAVAESRAPPATRRARSGRSGSIEPTSRCGGGHETCASRTVSQSTARVGPAASPRTAGRRCPSPPVSSCSSAVEKRVRPKRAPRRTSSMASKTRCTCASACRASCRSFTGGVVTKVSTEPPRGEPGGSGATHASTSFRRMGGCARGSLPASSLPEGAASDGFSWTT